MILLAISGSARRDSTNTALLTVMQGLAAPDLDIRVFAGLADLPVFSPDREGADTPPTVRDFQSAIDAADGLIISSPEYVRTLPGGLKNAIDWLVSGEAVINKPITLVHASHRGDDMLAALRIVLDTVSTRFNPDLFVRFPLLSKSTEEISDFLATPENARKITTYLSQVRAFVAGRSALSPEPPAVPALRLQAHSDTLD